MIWRIEIKHKKGIFDSFAAGIHKDIIDLGIKSVRDLEVVQIYNLEGRLTKEQASTVAAELLINPLTQTYAIYAQNKYQTKKTIADIHLVEIAFNPGVMDPVEESTIKAIKDLGIGEIAAVHTAKQYFLYGKLSRHTIEKIIEKVLSNKLIQHEVVDHTLLGGDQEKKNSAHFNLIVVDLNDASQARLLEISQQGQLFLNLDEMKTIQAHFRKLGRNPTDCELETIAQTWSEHCYHKTFRGNIRFESYENGKKKEEVINNLLKSTIVKATYEINKPWCVSVFHDNAGVIEFDEQDNICFKVETHNHPSALEPFGGANTGIGGVIRDTLGTGLGAKPICCTDVFCFAPPDMPEKDVPPGSLHPKRVMKGVVSGVKDYGNKMGIPTVNGAILFDRRFVGNPLVYCGNVGIMPKDKVEKKVYNKDLIVVVGGKTGRDGIHGATFSSGELTSESEVVSSGAVQIGNPIQEKKVQDALLKARDRGLYSAITDCGAGGLSSAIGEMGAELGARVDLDKVPLKYDGLMYMEIWISESQERMVLSVPQKHIDQLLDVFAQENVEATVIGEFTSTGKLELYFHNCQVCSLDMSFLHDGILRLTKSAVWKPSKEKEPRLEPKQNLTKTLLQALGHYNVCSKEWVIRQYDHEVQGTSVIKPLVGVHCDGPSDASVIAPKFGNVKGIAIANGINFRYGLIDPYWMAISNIDEALRQIVAVGGSIERIAILDNFCWGNPDKPDRLGGLVRAAQGCYQAAVSFQVPFISGKDSLYNEYTQGKESIAIPGTLLISAIGIVEDVRKTLTMDFKSAGNLIYCVGLTKDELGGSIYYDLYNCLGKSVPVVDFPAAVKIFKKLHQAVQGGYIAAMHDVSEGGIGVALAEMAFSGDLGVNVNLSRVPYQGKKRDDYILFSESNTRFIVEIPKEYQDSFETIMQDVLFGLIGEVTDNAHFIIHGVTQDVCIKTTITKLKDSWQKPLRW
ncbi:MAG: phosphoribosylformylglycinamidine synthase subunit PurL [Candidatus Omnitrophica bacterium]|nr:phosphoribosylformylglycinamidine synthase subunit PurL [Candidatus Omnitrophota bacterium]MCB9747336.1 phosphoribosylformylglycinamidine synthase subunit PurL [Candidatus Omnitrophota bacterium]